MTAAGQSDEVRVVLLKPGDVLAIGNLRDIDEATTEALARIRDEVGLRAVWLFAEDITLDVIHAATPPGDAPESGG